MATILIAEDDSDILSSLTEYLTKEGFEVLCRSSEAEGIATLKNGQITLYT